MDLLKGYIWSITLLADDICYMAPICWLFVLKVSPKPSFRKLWFQKPMKLTLSLSLSTYIYIYRTRERERESHEGTTKNRKQVLGVRGTLIQKHKVLSILVLGPLQNI